jgi:predicted lipoprotein with Yx(FWY)xxD motif
MNDAKPERGAFLTRGLTAAAALALVAAACGSSSHSSTSAASSTSGSSSSGSASSYTVSAKSVGNLGTVLVDGNGRTLYLLSSEQGGKVTCTSDTGCTGIWPPVVLPSGVSNPVAGSGIDSSMLGTAHTSSGDRVTYGGWPLYRYSGDSGPGATNGVGITSFGGTWHAVSTSGGPAGAAASGSTTTAPKSSGGGGYGGGY